MSTSNDTLPPRPQPPVNAETAPYWAGLRAHRLLLQRCTRCHTVRHYPRPLCAVCHAFEHDWVEASGRGTVHSWSTSHHAFEPAFKPDLPYTLVTVDLAEGVRLLARLAAGDPARLRVGLAVEITFEDIDDTLTLPGVRLAAPP